MRRIGYLYEKLIDVDYLISSIHKAFKKKKKTRSIKKVLEDPRKHAERISQMIQNGELPFLKERKISLIKDGKQKKNRTITKASNYEHILHHAAIGLIEKRIQNSSYRYSIASYPRRGDIFGKRHLEHWIKTYKGRKIYALKFDIKKFFDTIDRKILISKLCRIIKDKKFLQILVKIIYYDRSSTNKGVPIGYYSSQWFANFYLQSLDLFIKQSLLEKHMMRYMDDIVIISQNKRKLRKSFEAIHLYLEVNLCLKVKSNWQLFKMPYKPSKLMVEDGWRELNNYGRPIDFMGFKFYPWKTTIRKSTLRSARRAALRFSRFRSFRNAKSLMCYYGRLSHADVFSYISKWIKPIISKRSLQQVLKKYARLYDTQNAQKGPTNKNGGTIYVQEEN